MRPQQRPLGGDPGGQLARPQRGHVVPAEQPVVVEPAQPAAADLLAAAARDSAVPAAGQRPGPGDERLHQLSLVLTPGTLVPETQAPAVQLALAAGHQAPAPGQRPDRAAERRGVELLPADPGGQPGPAAAVAAAVMVAGGDRAAGRGARPCRGPVAAQVTGEQPALLVPLARPPAPVQVVSQPLQPAALAGSLLRSGGAGGNRGLPGHRYRLPAATASTARRLSSSRACR